VDGYDVRVVDEQGNTVAPGAEGEILIRGPSMFIGYFNPVDNASAFDDAGYFRSGDLGYVTQGSALVITGRSKDLIIRGGENISSKEIEDVLYEHPAVQEVAVVSMPHPRLGEGICAYVIPKDEKSPPTLADLTSICDAAGLAKQKWPERVEIVTELPRTAAGKIKKYELRAQILRKLDHGKPVSRA
jgi:non-ribosomal peptide synthetase component E (peptide arylation enzyme)